ncbi:hypothetical protein TRICI_004687 [Trichomonascus ciferrii]|uniref:Transcription factor Opi1 n=1 Tax=Trichomonascus ciferrii TaxID=44093 RepID=A0A642V6F9_9ASCO|nr:hypothetical protein TRICI_004687 [Trichomonascus ciferrii]
MMADDHAPPSYEAATAVNIRHTHTQTHLRRQSDNDVRVAAEALDALRTTSPSSSPEKGDTTGSFLARVGTTAMSGAYKVYTSGKTYSPRFRYSAEKLEAVLPDFSERSSYNVHKTGHNNRHRKTNSASSSRKRPMWQDVLVSATSLTQLSAESRQRLRYCLNLLKLANTRLAVTVNKLQELINREQASQMAQSIAANHVPQPPHAQNEKDITCLKQDLIDTIKKILTVVTTFAGNSLPEPARSHVKSYILRLPSNWVLSVNSTPVSTSPPPEPQQHDSPLSSEGSADSAPKTATTHDEIEAGGRVLNLANETLDMLGNIISIVDDTLERAESWCQKSTNNDSDNSHNEKDASPPRDPSSPHDLYDNKIQLDE